MELNLGHDIEFGTGLSDVNVPEELRKRYSIDRGEWMDKVFGGRGLTPSQVCAVSGTPGAGKTTLALVLGNKLARQGQSLVVFNSREESAYQIKMTAERLRIASRGGLVLGQEIMADKLLEKTQKYWDQMNATRLKKNPKAQPYHMTLIIDSLQCLNDGKYGLTSNKVTPVRVTRMLTEWAKRTYANVLMITQVTKSGDIAGKQEIKHMIDSWVHLGMEEKDKELKGFRVLSVNKNRFGSSGSKFYLDLGSSGFELVATVSAL